MHLNLLSCTILAVILLAGNTRGSAERITGHGDDADDGTGASPGVSVQQKQQAHHNNGHDEEESTRVTNGSEGPLRIRISGVQNQQDMSSSMEMKSGRKKAVKFSSHPVDGAFVATTVAPVRELDPVLNSESFPEEDEEAADTSAATATPSTIEQLGKAIKFIGTFVSWARAINPSTETSLADEYAHSNAAAQVAGGGEEQPQLRKGLIGEPRVDSDESAARSASSSAAAASTEVAEGRHIKGDPLKGYYDFVITEGSYKFWAVFQLATAALIIYSTFAAIYYSKVNPIVSDYDYVDYFGGRALGSSSSSAGRSLSDLDNTDVVDDDAEEEEEAGDELHGASGKSARQNATSSENRKNNKQENRSLLSGWTSMFEGGRRSWWVDHAASGFDFVLNAIDKMPQ